MFILKRENKYIRYLGGWLVEPKDLNNYDHLESGYFVVLGALWTDNMQDAHVFKTSHVTKNGDISNFLRNVQEKHGELEVIKVKLSIVEGE